MTALVQCRGVAKSYGTRVLLDQLDLTIDDGARLGIIGPNGAGKSTLLRLLGGGEEPDEGEVQRAKHLRVDEVAQAAEFPPDQTVEAAVLAHLEALAMTDPTLEGDGEQHARAGRALRRLDFTDPDQVIGTLSGGWRRRLALACAVAGRPDLLLLDEPTNHLDLEGIEWLEGYLAGAPFALALVSHDRAFLEAVATRILEIDPRLPGGYLLTEGGYAAHVTAREETLARQSKREETLQSKVRREQEWLRRGPKARGTKAHARIQAAGQLMADLTDVRARTADPGAADVDFAATGRRTKRLLTVRGLSYRLPDERVLFRDLDLVLGPGVRLGLVGPNGTGKTTLLRLLAGELEPSAGERRPAPNLRVVYFQQHRDSLPPQGSLRRALAPDGDSVVYNDREVHVVTWAHRFRFRTEQLDVPLEQLSGGEQAKVLIARLMLQPADLLLLDEPTNDLDIPTLEVLEEGLATFPGAVVLVTHDRYLIDQVTTAVVGLDGSGALGIYADYAQYRRATQAPDVDPAAEKDNRARRRERPRRQKALTYGEELEYRGLEPRIEAAEAVLTERQAAAEDPAVASDADELARRYAAVAEAQREVDALYARWQELEEALAQDGEDD